MHKFIKRGDFIEIHDGEKRHFVRRRDIRRVSLLNEKGHVAVEMPGITIVCRLMEVSHPKARDAGDLYSKLCGMMKDRVFTWI